MLAPAKGYTMLMPALTTYCALTVLSWVAGYAAPSASAANTGMGGVASPIYVDLATNARLPDSSVALMGAILSSRNDCNLDEPSL